MERMEIKLKECCLECEHFSLDTARLNFYPTCGCTERKIACTHMPVCDKYNSETVIEQLKCHGPVHVLSECTCEAKVEYDADLWFSVDEAMPKEKYDPMLEDFHSKAVIVAYKSSDGKMRVDTSIASHGRFFSCGEKVTHWMPIPEPPNA